MSLKYGLLGKSLKHSFSKDIHESLGDYNYELIEVSEEELESKIKSKEYNGFNVTIPYKKRVIGFCDELTKEATIAGAVNTLYWNGDKLIGHNTDVLGVQYLIEKVEKLEKVLILGSGGASGAVKAALKLNGIDDYVVVSREGDNNYSNLSRHLDANVIINTTPVGMYPQNGDSPITISDVSINDFKRLDTVIDVIYNPNKTKLLLDAEKLGIKTVSGIGMLVVQAVKSAEAWSLIKEDSIVTEKIINKILKKNQNIMLIGMPGSGKTTVAKGLSEILNKPYVDLDKMIVQKTQMAISEIFDNPNMGEKYFRKIETEVLREVSKLSGYIVATGGGIVVSEENHNLLKENSICVYINRDLNLLSKKGRPLSNQRGVKDLYSERYYLYEKLADITVENNRSFENNYYRELKSYSQKVKNEIDKYYQG